MATAKIVTQTELTAAEQTEARALRNELLSSRTTTEATGLGQQALNTVRELLDFASEWDSWAAAARAAVEAEQAAAADWASLSALVDAGGLDDLTLAEAPTPRPAVSQQATDKAAYRLAGGVEIRRVGAAYLVPSANTAGQVYRVEAGRCTCKAGQAGRSCWHIAAAAQLAEAA